MWKALGRAHVILKKEFETYVTHCITPVALESCLLVLFIVAVLLEHTLDYLLTPIIAISPILDLSPESLTTTKVQSSTEAVRGHFGFHFYIVLLE